MLNQLITRPLLQKNALSWCFWLVTASGFISPIMALDIRSTDALVQQWLSLEQQTAALESDWRQQQPLLQQRITLLEAEKAQLQQMLKDNQNNYSEVEAHRSQLLTEQTLMETEQQQVAQRLQQITQYLQTLAKQLPPPLLSVWSKEQATVNESSSSSERLQVALAQLSKLMDFDTRVTLHEMTLSDPEGRDVRVKQLYLGVSVAWFVSGDGSYAGMGWSTPDGWQWRFDENIDSDQISKAIAIYEKQHEADWVRMPLQLQAGQSNAKNTQRAQGE